MAKAKKRRKTGKRKTAKRKAAPRRKKRTAKRKAARSKHIPLAILKKRAAKLDRIIKARS